MHISPRPFPRPFDAGQVGPAPGASLARRLPLLLSIGAAVLIVNGVLLTCLLGANPVSTDGPAIIGP